MVRTHMLKDCIKEDQRKSVRNAIALRLNIRLEANRILNCLVLFCTDCVC